MCDFHDFGLTFFPYCVFALLKMSKNGFWVVARLPQRLKSTFLEIFSSLRRWPLLGAAPFKKFQKTLILAFEANSALSRKNETKIVKITHSAHCLPQRKFCFSNGVGSYLELLHHSKKKSFQFSK